MNALQRLPRSEESQLLDVVREHGLDASKLACFMTRQQGHGGGNAHGNFVRGFTIQYSLMLCEHCGSAFQLRVCPAKANELKERLRLSDGQ